MELFLKMVPGAGIEPARHIVTRDFKSLASTYSATRANRVLTLNLDVAFDNRK